MIAETWTPGGMVLVWQDVAGLKDISNKGREA